MTRTRRAPGVALALGIAILVGGAAAGYGPLVKEVLKSCPRDSFYGEDFWMGVNVLKVDQVRGIGDCCKLCDEEQACTKWTFCPSEETDGCKVPVGPLANKNFAAGTCLLTNGRANDNGTFLSWSFMQPGQVWSSGTYTPDGVDPQIFEDASVYQDDMEGIESRQDAFFCRKIRGQPSEFRPVGSTPADASPPPVSENGEVAYTGLRVKDGDGSQWAVLYFGDSTQFWLYRFDQLDYCDGEQPGCTVGISGGRVEEGVTCETDQDCCSGLFCKPREVSEVRVVYEDASGDVKYEPFRLEGQASPLVLPNECVRLHTGTMPEPGGGPRFEYPKFKGTPLDYCRSFGVRCGRPAADYFCQLNGYAHAVDWSRSKTPVTPPCETCAATVIPEQASACTTAFFPHCDTFQFVECGN